MTHGAADDEHLVINCDAMPRAIASSPDGNWFAWSDADRTLTFWDFRFGKKSAEFKNRPAEITAMAFSPDSKTLATAEGTDLLLWDVTKGQEVGRFRLTREGALRMVFSPDGRKLVTSGIEQAVIVWDIATGTKVVRIAGLYLFEATSETAVVAFRPDGTLLIGSLAQKYVRVWEVPERVARKVLHYNEDGFRAMHAAFSPDGRSLAVAVSKEDEKRIPYSEVQIWDLARGKVTVHERDISPHVRLNVSYSATPPLSATFPAQPETVSSIAFSPDGRQLVCGTTSALRVTLGFSSKTGPSGGIWKREGTVVRAWDVATRREVATFKGHTASILDVHFAGNVPRIISASKDKSIRFWNCPPAPLENTEPDSSAKRQESGMPPSPQKTGNSK